MVRTPAFGIRSRMSHTCDYYKQALVLVLWWMALVPQFAYERLSLFSIKWLTFDDVNDD